MAGRLRLEKLDLSRAGIYKDAEASKHPSSHRAVPAVTRAIAILRLLAASKTPLGLNAIANHLNLIPSTCLHILRILVREELVAFDSNKKLYFLDVGILNLARSAIRPDSFGNLILPALDSLAEKYPITALATRILNEEHMVVVATSGAEHVMRIRVERGSRFPTFMSATGRCVAAFGPFPMRTIKKQFQKLRWENPLSFETWSHEVEIAKRTGYGIDHGSYVAGLTVVAAPIIENQLTHVVVAIGLTEQIEKEQLKKITGDIKALAARYSHSDFSDVDLAKRE